MLWQWQGQVQVLVDSRRGQLAEHLGALRMLHAELLLLLLVSLAILGGHLLLLLHGGSERRQLAILVEQYVLVRLPVRQ